jgi:hypothetical protein
VAKKDSSSITKISFGKKSTGKAKKSFNKRDNKERNYRGQGR